MATAVGTRGVGVGGCEIRLGEDVTPPAPRCLTDSWSGPDSEPGDWAVGPRKALRPPDLSEFLTRGWQPWEGKVVGRGGVVVVGGAFQQVLLSSCHPGGLDFWPPQTSWPLALHFSAFFSPPLAPATPIICSPISGDLR